MKTLNHLPPYSAPASEIGIPPFPIQKMALQASKGFKVAGNHSQKTNRKPWSFYQLVTSMQITDAI